MDLVDQTTNRITGSAWVQDVVTGRKVFYLPERYMKPGSRRRLDGRPFLVWSRSEEVAVVDLTCLHSTGVLSECVYRQQ